VDAPASATVGNAEKQEKQKEVKQEGKREK